MPRFVTLQLRRADLRGLSVMVWGGDAPETDSAARLAPDGTRRDAADAPLEQGVAPASDDPTRGSSFVRLPGLIGRSLRFVWEAGRRELLVILVLEVLSGVALFAQLLLGRSIISTLIQDGEGGFRLSGLVPELLGLGAATVFGAFAASALSEGQRVLTELVTRHTSDRLIDVTTQVDLEAFDNPDFYDRLERSRSNAAQRMYELASGVIALGAGLTGLAALTAVLFSVGLPFLPLVVLAYVPLWLATARNGRSSYAFTFWATPADREREYLENVLTGKPEAKEVRLFGLAPLFRQRYSRLYDMRMAELRRVTKLRLRRSLLANVVSTTITLAAAVYLIQLSADGRIRTADAGVAVIATVQMGTRLRALGRGAGSIGECSLFLADFESFVRVKDSAIRQPPDQTIVPAFDSVVAERVTFVYPGTDKHVLRDVTLHLGCGEMIAVVGRNGSGKSTLAKLLCGLYRPTAGRVLMNGADVSSLPPDALRAASAAIFQDFVCYQLSARDNVGVGDTRAFDDHARIRRAAADAGIDETLAGLADGYATVLSRAFAGGAELSIGQWQRVALARAFFRDAPLVILDEPAAALDAEAEQELFAYIRRLRQGRAALVISHRMSTIRDADRIYVLDQGRVVETGTHEELVEAKGHYAELFNLQAAAYAREPESH